MQAFHGKRRPSDVNPYFFLQKFTPMPGKKFPWGYSQLSLLFLRMAVRLSLTCHRP